MQEFNAQQCIQRFHDLLDNIKTNNCSHDVKRANILNFFNQTKNHIKNIKGNMYVLLESASINSDFFKYAEDSLLHFFWSGLLENEKIPLFRGADEGHLLKSQPGIKDFLLMTGFFCAIQSIDGSGIIYNQALFNKAIELNSFHAIYCRFNFLKKTKNLVDKDINDLKLWAQKIKIHGTPGYFLAADIYYEISKYSSDSDIENKMQCMINLYTAIALNDYSENAIHNTSGGELRTYQIVDIENKINQYYTSLNISVSHQDLKQQGEKEAEKYIQQHLPHYLPSHNFSIH